ncbi:carboxypeptidase regulatory-like domain-containing protein [Maribacter sp. MMG018]|uniref:carboxypeptidase-like regulatory domain-containing protein n=1 Tax=Maribacter sp. MMG018 TaxID=2822688 RepID=UPI001B37C7F1|nr:carboxypeptidase-like regulatory domain-containing protein [Maribacter sp. MMG018]MBQ4915366.1 carboxypeptidase regulatory-like domain-containing protein [Maribacter sp. MMG018]
MSIFKNQNFKAVLLIVFTLLVSCEEDTIGDEAFGTLEGKVVSNSFNIPLENVKITTNPSSTTVFTDKDGNFIIEDISIGDYSVQADKDDFETSFEPSTIYSNKTTTVVFELDSVASKNLQPAIPTLISPQDKATDISNPVQFVWSSSKNDSDTITYTFELRDGNTGEIQIFENLQDTTLTIDNLSVGANYFWQVTADDAITESTQSKISSFQLRGIENNRFLYVRTLNGNNVIFSGGEPAGLNNSEVDQNEIQLTSSELNCYRPKANRTVNKIAYIRNQGGESHLFTMNLDGSGKTQLTKSIPIAGFRNDEIEFAWSNNGNVIYYPNFNSLYAINIDGSGLSKVYEAPSGEFITEVATNLSNNLIAIKTNDAAGYNVKIQTINPVSKSVTRTIIEGIPGAFGGLDYSINGNKILYTRDISGIENTQYRQLDSRIFEYDIANDNSIEIDTDKPTGYNNLDVSYAPNEGYVMYILTSNDGISEKKIYRKEINTSDDADPELLFTNAFMPNWE